MRICGKEMENALNTVNGLLPNIYLLLTILSNFCKSLLNLFPVQFFIFSPLMRKRLGYSCSGILIGASLCKESFYSFWIKAILSLLLNSFNNFKNQFFLEKSLNHLESKIVLESYLS